MNLEQQFWLRAVLQIGGSFLLAYLVHRLSRRLARPLTRLFLDKSRPASPERMGTLNQLLSSFISFLAFFIAALVSLTLFVRVDTLVWVVGLFSAAFGLSVRPMVSDIMTGIGFLFEDSFSVGEKVEILNIEGVIEEINLRSTLLRAPTGELYVIPNGEIRTIRNFSRGRFSTANITLYLAAADLGKAIPLLEEVGVEAVSLLPNLLEPWKVISATGTVGHQAELTLLAKARFGCAAELRPRLLSLVQERLAEKGIQLMN